MDENDDSYSRVPNDWVLEHDIYLEVLKEESLIQLLLKNDPEFETKIRELKNKHSKDNGL